jgi:hypothetical protein
LLVDVSETILIDKSQNGGETLEPSNTSLSRFKLFGWFSKVLEIFVDLELGSSETILIWLELRRKLLEL